MPIQYQTLNPFSEILPGLIAGEQRRARQPQAAPENPMAMSDPGQYEPTKPEVVLQDVDQDLAKYEAKWQQLKEWESKTGQKITPENKKKVMENYSKNFRSDIVRSALKSGIHPDVLADVITNIKNGSPDVEGDLEALNVLSKDNPEMKTAIQQKFAQYNQVENKNRQQRVQLLTKTLDRIDEFNMSPKNWIDKYGQMNKQTMQIVGNWKNYMAELAMLDPDAAQARMADMKAKRGGGTIKDYSGIQRTKEGFKRTPFSAASVEAGLAANPNIIPSTAYGLEKESMGKTFMNVGEQEDIARLKQLRRELPRPKKRGEKATEEVFTAYSEAWGDQAVEEMKKAGYK